MRPIKNNHTPEAKADPEAGRRLVEDAQWLHDQAMMSGRVIPDRSYLAEAIMLGSGINNALRVPLGNLLKKGITKKDVVMKQLREALGLDAAEQIIQESIPR